MTFGKLKDAVARLGFEREIEDDGALMPALYRALRTIFTDRPCEASKRLIKPAFSGKLVIPRLEHAGGKTEKYPLFGKALSMLLSGRGAFTIRSAAGTERKEFDSPYFPVRTRIGADAVIEFSGDYDFSVISLTCFETLRSASIGELPLYGERNDLSLGALIPDLLTISEPLTDSCGRVIPDVKQIGESVTLPDGYSGEVVVRYHRAPLLPSGAYPDEPIDVPTECAELLPLLVASYIWLEDSPDTAQYYLSLYRDGMDTLRRRMPRRGAIKYETNGWA